MFLTCCVLVGAPGHGRTATAAKLTRRASVAKAEVLPVAADLDLTAGGAQLAAYLEKEQDQIRSVTNPDELFKLLGQLERVTDVVFMKCLESCRSFLAITFRFAFAVPICWMRSIVESILGNGLVCWVVTGPVSPP